MSGHTRRLAVIAVLALAVLSGCLSSVTGSGDETMGPQTIETPSECQSGETTSYFDYPSDLPSQASGFELSASKGSVNSGESIEFELTNIANERKTTGTRHRYALQRHVADRWETVTRFREGRSGFNATAVPHEPGTGFMWSFRMSASGFSEGKFVVCEQLPAGEYRFIYEAPPALAVEFTLDDRNG